MSQLEKLTTMSQLEKLTTNSFKDCKKSGGGYCVQCYEYDNRYFWPLDTLTGLSDGSTLCPNCLTEKVIPASYFATASVKEIKEKLKEFSE
jgi:hypothetical protein